MREKEIGIMSMQRVINYGSFLQAYGLKHLVEATTKTKVRFVDYRFGEDLSNSSSVENNIIQRIVKNRSPFNYVHKKKYFKNIENKLITNLKEIGIDKKNYDDSVSDLIIGSDEVFNCTQPYPVGYSKQLFGEGYTNSSVISYAASFGNTSFNDLKIRGIDQEIGELLLKFKAISVRDENSFNIVNMLTGLEPSINMDPVLMYDFSNEIKNYQVTIKNYIIVYAYAGRLSMKEENYIKKFAKKHHKKILSIGHFSNIADENIICHPFYVFSYFKNADYIITDTFHGTVFSIKMNAKFCTLIRDTNKNKIEGLLSQLGRMDRAVNKLEDIDFLYKMNIDYQTTNEIIGKEKVKAQQYIENNIKND